MSKTTTTVTKETFFSKSAEGKLVPHFDPTGKISVPFWKEISELFSSRISVKTIENGWRMTINSLEIDETYPEKTDNTPGLLIVKLVKKSATPTVPATETTPGVPAVLPVITEEVIELVPTADQMTLKDVVLAHKEEIDEANFSVPKTAKVAKVKEPKVPKVKEPKTPKAPKEEIAKSKGALVAVLVALTANGVDLTKLIYDSAELAVVNGKKLGMKTISNEVAYTAFVEDVAAKTKAFRLLDADKLKSLVEKDYPATFTYMNEKNLW